MVRLYTMFISLQKIVNLSFFSKIKASPMLTPYYSIMEAGGKPSTWFPPGRLVELFKLEIN